MANAELLEVELRDRLLIGEVHVIDFRFGTAGGAQPVLPIIKIIFSSLFYQLHARSW